jgi:hypothetical protein
VIAELILRDPLRCHFAPPPCGDQSCEVALSEAHTLAASLELGALFLVCVSLMRCDVLGVLPCCDPLRLRLLLDFLDHSLHLCQKVFRDWSIAELILRDP